MLGATTVRLIVGGLVAFVPMVTTEDGIDYQKMRVFAPVAEGDDVHLAWLGYPARNYSGFDPERDVFCEKGALEIMARDGSRFCWHFLSRVRLEIRDIKKSRYQPEGLPGTQYPTPQNYKNFYWITDMKKADSELGDVKPTEDTESRFEVTFPYKSKANCHIAGAYVGDDYYAYKFKYGSLFGSGLDLPVIADLAYFELDASRSIGIVAKDLNGEVRLTVQLSATCAECGGFCHECPGGCEDCEGRIDVALDHSPPPGGDFSLQHFGRLFDVAMNHSGKRPFPHKRGSIEKIGAVEAFSCESAFIPFTGMVQLRENDLLFKLVDEEHRATARFYYPLFSLNPASTLLGPPVCPSSRFPQQ